MCEAEQMIVNLALLHIAEDFAGADDFPKPQRGVGIAGMQVGMGPLGGPAERGPEFFGVVFRKSPKQIVKRLHHRSRISSPPPANSRREFTLEYATQLNNNPVDNLDATGRKKDLCRRGPTFVVAQERQRSSCPASCLVHLSPA